MASEVFQLAILLSLKDAASGGLDRFTAKLRSTGKDGEKFASDFARIRSELNRDLAIGGVGVSGLALMGKGIKMAGDFQQSMTDLRTSFAEVGKDGQIDLSVLGPDMQKAEVVAMRLGNALPGTTEDFVKMMQVLKQNGLTTETILNGAADAVGNLAVASHAVPAEIAADFAQFGNLFRLRSQDFAPAADVFSRIYSSTGQTSAELVEAAKYFEGRAGTSLGIGGLKDAEQYARLFGLLGKQGMRGSMACMGLTNFFDGYSQHKDKLKDLTKQTGIKLEFFDKKGKFVGLEEVIRQMSQFNKLTDEDRSVWMETLFGTLGKGVGNVLTNVEAWKKFNAEQDKTISLQQKNAEIAKNFNNQVEALTGSVKNLVITAMGPLLPDLTSAASTVNTVVGSLVGVANAHPGLTRTLGTLALYGSTAMAVYGGVKTLTSGFQLLKIAMAFSRGESALQYFTQASGGISRTESAISSLASRGNERLADSLVVVEKRAAASTNGLERFAAGATKAKNAAEDERMGLIRFAREFKTVETGADKARGKLAGLRDSLSSLAGSGVVKIGLQIGAIVGIEAIISKAISNYAEGEARKKAAQETRDEQFRGYSGGWMLESAPKAKTQPVATIQRGKQIFDDFNQIGNELKDALEGEPMKKRLNWRNMVPDNMMADAIDKLGKATGLGTWEDLWGNRSSPSWFGNKQRVGNQFTGATGLFSTDQTAAAMSKNRALSDPSAMAGFLFNVRKNLPKDQASLVEQSAQKAFPKEQVYEKALPLLQSLEEAARAQQQNTGQIQQQSQSFIAALSSLQQPTAATAELFSGLPQPVTGVNQAFNDLRPPTDLTRQSMVEIYNSAGRVPGAFNNIFVSSTNVATALDSLSVKMASFQPPASPGTGTGTPGPNGQPVPATPFAVGGSITRSGLAYIHAHEEIVPAKARAFRDTLGQNMIKSFAMLREQSRETEAAQPFSFPFEKNSAGEGSVAPPAMPGNHRTNYRGPFANGPTPTRPSIFDPPQSFAGGPLMKLEAARGRDTVRDAQHKQASDGPINVTLHITNNFAKSTSKEDQLDVKRMILGEKNTIINVIKNEMRRGRMKA